MANEKYIGLKTRLVISFLIVVTLQFISASILFFALKNISQQVGFLAKNKEFTLLNLAQDIRYQDLVLTDSVRGILIDPDSTTERQRYDDYAIKIDQSIKEAMDKEKDNAGVQRMFGELDVLNQKLVELETAMMNISGSDVEKAEDIFNGEYAKLRVSFKEILDEYAVEKRNALDANSTEVYDNSRRYMMVGIIANSIALILAVLISMLVGVRLGKTVSVLTAAARRMSQGDLTVTWEQIKNYDETDLLSISLKSLADDFRDVIATIQNSADILASSSGQLSSSMESANMATQQVASAIGQIAGGTESQVAAVNQTKDAVSNMDNALDNSGAASKRLMDIASSTSQRSEAGKTAVTNAVDRVMAVSVSTNSVYSIVQDLSSKSNDIQSVVDLISDIAEQTNLLALNAAIEAARAGEQGRGFAVVSDEIRKLAEKAQASTKKILALIVQIRRLVSDAASAMEETTVVVGRATESISEAGVEFESISQGIVETHAQVRSLIEAENRIEAAHKQVSVAMETIASIIEEASASVEEVSASTEEQTGSIEELTASAKGLAGMAQKFQRMTGKFKVR